MSRLSATFAALKKQNRAAFIPFITAGDPDFETSCALLKSLPAAGADIIELGIPFTDPMADGPSVQASSLRALEAGMSLPRVLDLVRKFRKVDAKTPIVLMGYYNPIHALGTARFAKDAAEAGIDGLIAVDVPPEEDEVLRVPMKGQGLDLIRLVTPTSNDARLKTIVKDASGFLYYVSITGVTGTKDFAQGQVQEALTRIRAATPLPVAVGFGIKTAEHAAAIARFADAAVVGSAIVDRVLAGKTQGKPRDSLVNDVAEFCRTLADSVHAARAAAVVG